MEYYATMKKKEIPPSVAMWIDPENIMLGEIG